MPFAEIENAEEATRQWWLRNYGTDVPDEVRSWLRSMSRQEVQRALRAEHIMDDLTLMKTQESRRLGMTRLANVEEQIEHVHQQQEWLRRFVRINTELREQTAKLYEVNKRQATVMSEERELERFETFEAVSGRFQRLRILNRTINAARAEQGRLAVEADEAQRQSDESEKKLNIELQKNAEMQAELSEIALAMAESERLHSAIDTMGDSLQSHAGLSASLQTNLDELRSKLHEYAADKDALLTQLETLRQELHSIEAHRNMILHGEAIQVQLDELLATMQLRDDLQQQLSVAMRQQNERNEQLGRLFAESQNLDASILAIREEVEGHKRNMAGQDSYMLQRRTIELRSRRIMLETGLSLWKSIAAGYDQIETKEQIITQLRLDAEHLNRDIDVRETDVRQLRRMSDEKTYHWTLSKSQNVISLRQDLEETVPCPVCGATHHPWHSESSTQQNALISSMKADCEMLSSELQAKNQHLQDLQLQLTGVRGRIQTETANLDMLRDRQKKDTDEWQTFSQLDRSLVECSPTTNREARSSMLRQLIEKSAVDEEAAQKELDAFNFHQDAISRLSSDIQKKQAEANDLAVRLNEVNTACQVLARQVERINSGLATATQDYRRRYDVLDRSITIPDWFRMWKNSSESVKLRIKEMMELWQTASDGIARCESEISKAQLHIDLVSKAFEAVSADISEADSVRRKGEEKVSKWEDTVGKLFNGESARIHFINSYESLEAQREKCRRTEEEHRLCLQRLYGIKARYANLDSEIHRTEAMASEEQQGLDMWMHNYNANNPPVQMGELERVLADGIDWNVLRRQIRSTAIEQAITQARVDELRAEIIALQAEGMKPVADDGSSEQALLREQLTELEGQRTEILRQVAHYDELICAHMRAQSTRLEP